MVLGTVLVSAALYLLLWNLWENKAAGSAVKKTLPQIKEQIEIQSTFGLSTDKTSYPDPYDPTMREVEIDGYGYVGYLSIPTIALELPVMAQWDYTRLKIAPCRYTGSAKTDNLVICAHNYAKHFGPIGDLKPGDAVYFTDMDGQVYQYEVLSIDILPPTAIEDMTAGDYDLSLFTCTYGGKSRVTVRCDRKE